VLGGAICHITANSADLQGGGLNIALRADASVERSAITGNSAPCLSGVGAGCVRWAQFSFLCGRLQAANVTVSENESTDEDCGAVGATSFLEHVTITRNVGGGESRG